MFVKLIMSRISQVCVVFVNTNYPSLVSSSVDSLLYVNLLVFMNSF
jgi:hypothetical protein